MTIYYLMIKTHNITGLKYLCQTKQNPFKYKGSGKDWKPHLKQYGEAHTTEIIRECQSIEEVGKWGRYYSTYYNIVNAQDDFGNKIWANRIPETGGGTGLLNPSAETRARRSAGIKAALAKLTPEARAQQSANKSAAGKAAYAKLPPEVQERRLASYRATLANETPENRAKRSASSKAIWANMTPEERTRRIEAQAASMRKNGHWQ